jgi:hypothetical protein
MLVFIVIAITILFVVYLAANSIIEDQPAAGVGAFALMIMACICLLTLSRVEQAAAAFCHNVHGQSLHDYSVTAGTFTCTGPDKTAIIYPMPRKSL